MVVEVMGRHAGWIALYAGIAGGGDVILIPEIPFAIERVCEKIQAPRVARPPILDRRRGRRGAARGGESWWSSRLRTASASRGLGGIAELVAQWISDAYRQGNALAGARAPPAWRQPRDDRPFAGAADGVRGDPISGEHRSERHRGAALRPARIRAAR